jgi:hypothetical protein
MSEIKQVSNLEQVSKVTHVYEINSIVRRLIRYRNENFSDLKKTVRYFAPGKNVHLSLHLYEDVIMLRGYDSMWNKFLSKQDHTIHLNFHTSSDKLFHNVRLITAMYLDKYHAENNEECVQDILYAWTGSDSLANDIIHGLRNSNNHYIIHAHSDNIPELSEKEEQDNYVIADSYAFAEACEYAESRSRSR